MKQNNSEKQGSAVLYKFDEAGNAYYITNYHVAYYSSSATKKAYPYFRLELYGHDKAFHYMPAQFVGGSNSYDIAVLKVDAEKYISTTHAKPVTICKDVSPAGTAVVAIGNTMSEGINISKGIIDIESEYFTLTSAMEISTTQRLIQHDAYIAGGNSGGGLFNMNGELVGITNGGVQTNERKNYAIPASVAKGVADKLISAYEADNYSYELSVCDLKITNFRYDTISSFNETTNVVETIDKFRVSAIDESSVFFGKLIANGVNSDRYISAKINDKEIDFSREYMFNELTLTLKVGDKLTFVVQRMGETDPVEVSATIIAEMFVSVL